MLALTIIGTIMLGLIIISLLVFGLMDYVSVGEAVMYIMLIATFAYLIVLLWILYKH